MAGSIVLTTAGAWDEQPSVVIDTPGAVGIAGQTVTVDLAGDLAVSISTAGAVAVAGQTLTASMSGERTAATVWPNGTVAADSAALADVQAAVDEAVDGQIVTIPNGSATWTGGITTTKKILIRALNTTATPAGTAGAGATSRNVTITNNSATPLFAFTTGTNYHVGISGIRFNEGSGDGAHLSVSGSGSKVPLISDCYFQNKSRNWPAQPCLLMTCRGGVMWNCVMEGTQTVTLVGEGSFVLKLPDGIRNWTTASTMGMLDDGTWNFYVEDSTFKNVGNCPDIDDHGRFVCRRFVYDGSWAETHGFTSLWGGRHWEFYDGVFSNTTSMRNLANRYFWCRAGTGLFTGNVVNNDTFTGDYGGDVVQMNVGDNQAPSGSYLIPRQPGCGHNGTSYVSDPIYIWGNTGARAHTWSFQGQPGGWEAVVVSGRDVFANAGAKPGYTKYTYPHPLRVTP